MKYIRDIFAFLAVAAAVSGCSGTVDDSALPVLEADRTEVELVSGEEVRFTVTYNGADVTAESEIMLDNLARTQDSWGSVFMPEEAGEYTFSAVYGGKRSNTVTINVKEPVRETESKYEKHVSIVEFTGSWCNFCPAGYDRMIFVLNKPAMAKYKDRVHLSAFHSGNDVMTIAASDDIFDLFKKQWSLEYPSFVSDLKYAGNLTQDAISFFQESVVNCFEEEQPHCGVAVSSVVDTGRKEVEVTVKVASEYTSEYRVVVFVVEDGIKGMQVSPAYPNGNPDHIHKHVARKVVTNYAGTFTGERLTSNGVIRSGEEASKTWTFALDGAWKLENTEIYAWALDMDGCVNNMNVCPIDNGNSDYNFKK